MTRCQNRSRWIGTLFCCVALITFGAVQVPGHAISAAGAKPVVAPNSFTELADAASPAVVNIRTVKTVDNGGQVFRHFFGDQQGPQGPQQGPQGGPFDEFFDGFFGQQDPREFKQKSLGSGFIIDKQGFIVTNNHVISNAEEIQVKLKNGDEFDAKIIGSDPNTDIALIKIEADKDLPQLNLGDSNKARIGQWVMAIGNPFGLEHTVTAGIISAKGRVIGAGPYDDFIQTDASINPGNSGGPLINMEGDVIGIATAMVAGGEGIGFATPSSLAKDIIGQLKQSGEVTRGWIGVGIQELNQELKDYYDVSSGVLVTQVFANQPAAKAGLQQNDIIVSVNDKAVNTPRELSQTIAEIEPGKTAELEVVRNGQATTLDVEVTKRQEENLAGMQQGQEKPQPGEQKPARDVLGLEVSNITDTIAQRYKLEDTKGVIITLIEPGSKAFEAGFTQGDIIREINHQPVNAVEDYRKIVKETKQGDALFFYVMRPFQGIQIVKITR